MKFEFIINLPTRRKENKQPELVHRMVVEHKAKNLKEMTTYISNEPFITVEEFFPDHTGEFNFNNGEITVNTNLIAKAKVWIP